MKKNMGTADRMIRIIIAALIAILYFTNVLTGTLGLNPYWFWRVFLY
jgi:hypothetical protein